MPDLAVHLSAGVILRRALPGGPGRMGVLLGACLPDLVFKSLHLILQVPGDYALVADTPAGVLLIGYAACFLFVEGERPAAFAGMFLGGILHLLLDSLKAHLGMGGIRWLFPLSWSAHGFEAYLPENGIYATVPAILLALGLEWLPSRRGPSASSSGWRAPQAPPPVGDDR